MRVPGYWGVAAEKDPPSQLLCALEQCWLVCSPQSALVSATPTQASLKPSLTSERLSVESRCGRPWAGGGSKEFWREATAQNILGLDVCTCRSVALHPPLLCTFSSPDSFAVSV